MEIVVGTVLGFLSGLGIGGGSLLILYLTLIAGMDPSTARGINLLFYLPCAGIASLLRWKSGAVDQQKVLPAAVAGCLAAALFTWLAPSIDIQMLEKGFGLLLVAAGVRELTYRK